MEVDEIQRQVCKFQRVSSNGSTTTTDNNNNISSNPQKLATSRGNSDLHNRVDDTGGGGAGGGGAGGVTRLCGWPSSRIIRVSRASGGKDRHSKVLTSKGLRDRRVRLSVGTAIQFYDLQDRLGFDQPSKAVEWLLKAASSSIDELPSLDIPVVGAFPDHRIHHQVGSEKKFVGDGNDLRDRMYQLQCNSNNNYINFTQAISKSPSCSSTSETSKGSGLSLSRSDTRTKARERAREISVLKKDKEKEKEIDSTRVVALNQVNSIPENSSFTDLLTGGINATTATATTTRSPMEYFFNRPQQPSQQLFQLPQFNITSGDNLHHFSFDSFLPAVPPIGGTVGGERQNINFLTTPTPPASVGGGVVAPGGFTRGTLQSNLQSPLMGHHHHLQRFQSSSIDGSSSANLPFFIVPNAAADHFSTTGGYHLGYSGGGNHHKEKSKN